MGFPMKTRSKDKKNASGDCEQSSYSRNRRPLSVKAIEKKFNSIIKKLKISVSKKTTEASKPNNTTTRRTDPKRRCGERAKIKKPSIMKKTQAKKKGQKPLVLPPPTQNSTSTGATACKRRSAVKTIKKALKVRRGKKQPLRGRKRKLENDNATQTSCNAEPCSMEQAEPIVEVELVVSPVKFGQMDEEKGKSGQPSNVLPPLEIPAPLEDKLGDPPAELSEMEEETGEIPQPSDALPSPKMPTAAAASSDVPPTNVEEVEKMAMTHDNNVLEGRVCPELPEAVPENLEENQLPEQKDLGENDSAQRITPPASSGLVSFTLKKDKPIAPQCENSEDKEGAEKISGFTTPPDETRILTLSYELSFSTPVSNEPITCLEEPEEVCNANQEVVRDMAQDEIISQNSPLALPPAPLTPEAIEEVVGIVVQHSPELEPAVTVSQEAANNLHILANAAVSVSQLRIPHQANPSGSQTSVEQLVACERTAPTPVYVSANKKTPRKSPPVSSTFKTIQKKIPAKKGAITHQHKTPSQPSMRTQGDWASAFAQTLDTSSIALVHLRSMSSQRQPQPHLASTQRSARTLAVPEPVAPNRATPHTTSIPETQGRRMPYSDFIETSKSRLLAASLVFVPRSMLPEETQGTSNQQQLQRVFESPASSISQNVYAQPNFQTQREIPAATNQFISQCYLQSQQGSPAVQQQRMLHSSSMEGIASRFGAASYPGPPPPNQLVTRPSSIAESQLRNILLLQSTSGPPAPFIPQNAVLHPNFQAQRRVTNPVVPNQFFSQCYLQSQQVAASSSTARSPPQQYGQGPFPQGQPTLGWPAYLSRGDTLTAPTQPPLPGPGYSRCSCFTCNPPPAAPPASQRYVNNPSVNFRAPTSAASSTSGAYVQQLRSMPLNLTPYGGNNNVEESYYHCPDCCCTFRTEAEYRIHKGLC